ncbi:MAG: 2-amino-4-hydroxy-6-hydroxymethyldihydropteridine diphosphokinase [Chthoniobacteraceae bacterium]
MRTGIALGSNLGDRLVNLTAGHEAVMRLPGISAPVHHSRVYETEPVGTGPDAGPFLNAVIEVEFSADPFALLAGLRSIESALGRPIRYPRNAPRTLDLDILYVSDLLLNDGALILPHPRLHLRRFVLAPLNDIRPELRLPGQTSSVAELLASLDDPSAVTVFADAW